jgi:hypothetical protein
MANKGKHTHGSETIRKVSNSVKTKLTWYYLQIHVTIICLHATQKFVIVSHIHKNLCVAADSLVQDAKRTSLEVCRVSIWLFIRVHDTVTDILNCCILRFDMGSCSLRIISWLTLSDNKLVNFASSEVRSASRGAGEQVMMLSVVCRRSMLRRGTTTRPRCSWIEIIEITHKHPFANLLGIFST